jgi:hypothetical protein
MENSGRVEDVLCEGNDFRQNFNNGVCIANRGDFTRSTVSNNKFHNNGFGEPIARWSGSTGALRRRLRGLPRFHRGEPRLRLQWALTASASRASPSPGTTTARTAGSTSGSILMSALADLLRLWVRRLPAHRAAGDQPDQLHQRGRHAATASAASAWRPTPINPQCAPATSARSPGPTSRPSRARAIPPGRHRPRAAACRRGQRQRRRHRPHHR